MPTYQAPGVYIDEAGRRPGMPSAAPATLFVCDTLQDDETHIVRVAGMADYAAQWGSPDTHLVGRALRHFFANGGHTAHVLRLAKDEDGVAAAIASALAAGGALETASFTLLCAPGLADLPALKALQQWCAARDAFLLIDAPRDASHDAVLAHADALAGEDASHSALYHPWLRDARGACPPCGALAGLYTRNDAAHGPWKAPAGTDADLRGVLGVQVMLSDQEITRLNPRAVNAIRWGRSSVIAWSARTLAGQDGNASAFKYVSVRRLASHLQLTLRHDLAWVAFESNTPALWARVASHAERVLQGLFLEGAFRGTRPRDAYVVRCGSDTLTADDIAHGRVHLLVGFAPLKPSEFVMLRITLQAADAT
ncbi:phage tail sheath subtilisin-like domain-containing protein [Pseudoxanthomonas sp. SL93]|uniref:phage tail sheath family protein n=1 Tax=Pseudoxanthomonas sp. SL93 TaxID=2995142 RepID=UPI00226FCEF5|nr:phage tail sheath subtilisin-like domain-containing protein [Pseudoxanthomonas sp. SL93]WAC62112.1 phage tail sheath subtilisin-like domain-containing protein [Pseudoxanthomonas sp. SL93]